MSGLLLALLLALAPAARAQTMSEEEGSADWGLVSAGTIVLFYDTKGAAAYVAMTRRELPPDAEVLPGEVYGRGCQYSLSIPLGSPLNRSSQSVSAARGRAGYGKALDEIRLRNPGLRGIWDVKLDDHTLSVLGFFRRVCTEVTARGFR